MVLQDNFFIEQILPKAVLRILSVEEMAEYRRPFAEPGEGRRPALTWVLQSPIDGEPVRRRRCCSGPGRVSSPGKCPINPVFIWLPRRLEIDIPRFNLFSGVMSRKPRL